MVEICFYRAWDKEEKEVRESPGAIYVCCVPPGRFLEQHCRDFCTTYMLDHHYVEFFYRGNSFGGNTRINSRHRADSFPFSGGYTLKIYVRSHDPVTRKRLCYIEKAFDYLFKQYGSE